MKIAIIGTGNVGTAIARGLRRTEYKVILGSRRPGSEEAMSMATELSCTVALPAEAAQQAEILILSLPWAAAEQAVKSLGDLTGKIVIDCMNPLGMVDGKLSLLLGHSTSGGETVQGWLPNARVVKTLNQVGAEVMADNSHLPHRPVQLMAGDDADAKAKVGALLSELGFDPLDAGDLTKARILEPFAMVWINQAILRGKGRNWAFAVVASDAA